MTDVRLSQECEDPRFGHRTVMPVIAFVLLAWLLGCLVVMTLCVAMKRDDARLHANHGGRALDRGDVPLRRGRAA